MKKNEHHKDNDTIAFEVDALGRRIEKVDAIAGTTTRYYYDDQRAAVQTQVSGGKNNPLKYVDPSGHTFTFNYGPLGNYGSTGSTWSTNAVSGGNYSGYGFSNSLSSYGFTSWNYYPSISYNISAPLWSSTSTFSASYSNSISGGAYSSYNTGSNLYMRNIHSSLCLSHLNSFPNHNFLSTSSVYSGRLSTGGVNVFYQYYVFTSDFIKWGSSGFKDTEGMKR